MKQEDKELLLKDLCARLPYGVKIYNPHPQFPNTKTLTSIRGTMKSYWITFSTDYESIDVDWNIGDKEEDAPKPYLRPMSSMTKEERKHLQLLHDIISDENYGDGYSPTAWEMISEFNDYCYMHHIDNRGLIGKGLALEAPNNMYK